MGFTGITVSDYMAVEQLNSLQHVASNNAAAGALALNSGVDMELPTPAGYPDLAAAVKAGKVTAKDLDAAVARVLTIKFRAGLFDHPFVDPDKAAEVVGNGKHGELARKVADEAIILLQNKGNVLPLDAAKIKTIAVIGPNAIKKRQGTYSGMPPYFVTVFDGIRKRVGGGAKVRRQFSGVVVPVLGGNEVVSRESIGQMIPGSPPAYGDSDTLELPGRQNELLGILGHESQFRIQANAYNLFNKTDLEPIAFGSPESTIENTLFGLSPTADAGRVIEFLARIQF